MAISETAGLSFSVMRLAGSTVSDRSTVPESRAEASAIVAELREDLATSEPAREIARLVLAQRPGGAPVAVQRALTGSAVDLLPSYARTMLGLRRPLAGAYPARMATRTMSETLRWAFRQR